MPGRFWMGGVGVTMGLAAVAVPLLSVAVPAQAAAGGSGGGRGLASAWASAPSVISNTSFAGYQASVAPGSATSSAAQFKVPRLSCTAADRRITSRAGGVVNNLKSHAFAFLLRACHR